MVTSRKTRGKAPAKARASTQQPTARKNTSRSRPRPASPTYHVDFGYRHDHEPQALQLTIDDRELYPMVKQWQYVVANRRRVTAVAREALGEDLLEWMRRVSGLDKRELNAHMRRMARAGIVEVRIEHQAESVGWSARLFPWEFALALLTRPHREVDAQFSVIRHLKTGPATAHAKLHAEPMLIVRSGPAGIGERVDLDRECRKVQEALGSLCALVPDPLLRDPDKVTLAQRLADGQPALVHLAGVDPQAAAELGVTYLSDASVEPDAFVLAGAAGTIDAVNPEVMATILAAARTKPYLAAVASSYSAQRIAALAVANGARHAIGFLDTITDTDAFVFFGEFYQRLAAGSTLLAAFEAARLAWAEQSQNQRGGVVLWSSESLLATRPAASARKAKAKRTPSHIEDIPASLKFQFELKTDGAARRTAVHSTSLNYSMLHNDRSPFSLFRLEKAVDGSLPPVQVEVALELGDEPCRFRFSRTLPVTATAVDFAQQIRLPLGAGMLRRCTESLRTNLYIRVTCADHVVHESSERVTVLPVDEWRDDGEDHRWLPSFVLPRDPAVLTVIKAAQRYLRTLADDYNASFDGYQRLAMDDSNAAAVVDTQVQAVWAALQHDLPINYINPPPSYTSQSQRLRSPSEIFRGNAATCIDLALLFASCLEFIGIHPAVFLISGHAFPAYWRSDKAWWQMMQLRVGTALTSELAASRTGLVSFATGAAESWMLSGQDNLAELLGYVQDGQLAPFESTLVTARRGFHESLEQGPGLLHPDTFDAMLDIQAARGANVTPLPVFDNFN